MQMLKSLLGVYAMPFAMFGLAGVATTVMYVTSSRRIAEERRSRVVLLMLLGNLGGIALLTLPPNGPNPIVGGWTARVNLIPGRSLWWSITGPGQRWTVMYVAGNVLLFALAALLAREHFNWSTRRTVLAGIGLSVGIELTQAILNLGRVCDVDDVLVNGLGVILGASALPWLVRPRVRRRWDHV